MGYTTIQVSSKTRKKLESKKLYPKESLDNVISRLLNVDDSEHLSKQTIKNIEAALEDVKHGRIYSLKEVKEDLGLK